MKRIALMIVALTLLSFVSGQADYAIVNNSTSGQTAHDSLSIPFFLLDSAGNQVAIASGDSVFLTVWYPGGALAFADSGAYNDADITSQVQGGMSWYSWQAQVSYLDGTPTEGTYSYIFGIHDKTSANLWTSFTGSFQLYATSDFDKVLDSIGLAQKEVENIDAWNPHSAADIWAVGTRALTDKAGFALTAAEHGLIEDEVYANRNDYKADVSALALQAELDGLVMFFGACDGCYQILYPRSGTVNKDSVIVIDPSLGNDSLVGKIIFYHGTTPSVYDSSYYYMDEPW